MYISAHVREAHRARIEYRDRRQLGNRNIYAVESSRKFDALRRNKNGISVKIARARRLERASPRACKQRRSQGFTAIGTADGTIIDAVRLILDASAVGARQRFYGGGMIGVHSSRVCRSPAVHPLFTSLSPAVQCGVDAIIPPRATEGIVEGWVVGDGIDFGIFNTGAGTEASSFYAGDVVIGVALESPA